MDGGVCPATVGVKRWMNEAKGARAVDLRKSLYDSCGQVLLVVMFVLAVLLLLGAAAATLASSTGIGAAAQRHRTQAYYLAEAGVERALAKLQDSPLWEDPGGNTLAEPSKGIKSVSVINVYDPATGTRLATIESVGRSGEARKTLEVKVQIVSAATLFKGLAVLPAKGRKGKAKSESWKATDIKEDVTVKQENGNNGILMVRGNLKVKNNAYVTADVYASGRIRVQNGTINGAVYEFYYGVPSFPTLPADQTGWGAQLLSESIIRPNLLSVMHGVYFASESIEITGGTYTGPLIIIATEEITVTGNVYATDREQGLLTLIALGKAEQKKGGGPKRGEVTFSNNVNNVDALILAREFEPSDREKTSIPVRLYGGIVAQELGGKRPVELTFCNPELVAQSLPEALKNIEKSRSITLISWKEK